MFVPALGLRLLASLLTAQQARDIATLLAFERDTAEQPIPAADGDRPWQAHTDAAGALRGDRPVRDRSEPPAHAPSPADPTRLISCSVRLNTTAAGRQRGIDRAPTADGDVTAIDRPRTNGLRTRIEDDLEQLDRDLADWWDFDCTRPHLTLLGPVTLRAHGNPQAMARSGCAAATRRRLPTSPPARTARPSTKQRLPCSRPAVGRPKTDPVSARAYVHRITAGARARLGTDPTTGQKHLSSGHRGPTR